MRIDNLDFQKDLLKELMESNVGNYTAYYDADDEYNWRMHFVGPALDSNTCEMVQLDKDKEASSVDEVIDTLKGTSEKGLIHNYFLAMPRMIEEDEEDYLHYYSGVFCIENFEVDDKNKEVIFKLKHTGMMDDYN